MRTTAAHRVVDLYDETDARADVEEAVVCRPRRNPESLNRRRHPHGQRWRVGGFEVARVEWMMWTIEINRKTVAIAFGGVALAMLGLANVLGGLAKDYSQLTPWPLNCTATPPTLQTHPARALTDLPQIATTDYAPQVSVVAKTTIYVLLCDGRYERRLYPSYQQGEVFSELRPGEYRVAVMTAEVTVPPPTLQGEAAYPP